MKKIIIEAVEVTKKRIEIILTEDGLTESKAKDLATLSGEIISSDSAVYPHLKTYLDMDSDREEKSCLFDLKIELKES